MILCRECRTESKGMKKERLNLGKELDVFVMFV